MSTQITCGLFVGLFYDSIVNSGFDQDKLEVMIDDCDVDNGSFYYDSSPDENVVGFWCDGHDSYSEVDLDLLNERVYKLSKRFEDLFGLKPKLYTTLFVC